MTKKAKKQAKKSKIPATGPRRVVATLELQTDTPVNELRAFFKEIGADYDRILGKVRQVQVNVIVRGPNVVPREKVAP